MEITWQLPSSIEHINVAVSYGRNWKTAPVYLISPFLSHLFEALRPCSDGKGLGWVAEMPKFKSGS